MLCCTFVPVRVAKKLHGHFRQTERLVEFAVRQQPRVLSYLRAVELKLQLTINSRPKTASFILTHKSLLPEWQKWPPNAPCE